LRGLSGALVAVIGSLLPRVRFTCRSIGQVHMVAVAAGALCNAA
jgi:hypothetical protein